MSFTTPTIVNVFGSRHPGAHVRVAPTGSANPVLFANVSLITRLEESEVSSLEKSLPAIKFQPTVLPYSEVTINVPHPLFRSISLPSRKKPAFHIVISAVELLDSAISSTTPVFFNLV